MPRFTWTPDQGVTRSSKANVNKVAFGDGYSQRSANGINSLMMTWPVSFTGRLKTEVTAIVAFFETLDGTGSFDWIDPSGNDRKFTCAEWSDTYNHDGDCAVSATFERVYES